MTRMRFGAKVDNYGDNVRRHGLIEPARRAEEAGFDAIWCSDHIVMPRETRSPYPFSADGTIRWEPTDAWYDAIVTLATLAAVTERVEIGVGVLLVPLRNPVELAKQLASVDALTGGRVVLGIGAGWLKEEFDALGVDFTTRGRRLDEWITLLRDCWTGTPSSFEGEHYTLPEGVLCYPTPAHPIPLVIGGMSDAALRRAALLGDGWFPLPRADEDPVTIVRDGVARIREIAGDNDRSRRVILNAAAPEALAPLLPALTNLGVTDALVDVDWDDPKGPERALSILRP